MKCSFTILFTCLFIINSFSQSFIDKYFQDLVEDVNSTSISISGEMFRYASVLVDDSNEEKLRTKEVLSGIKSLQFVSMEDAINPEVEYQKGLRTIPDRMSEMVSVKSKGSKLKVFLDEEDDTVYEIIAIGKEEQSFFVGSILCEIRLEDVSQFLNQIQKQDNNVFKQLRDVDYDELKIYPNPVSSNSTLYIQIPISLKGARATLTDSSGKTVKTFTLENTEQEVDIDNLIAGNYILSASNERVQLQKKVLIVN